MHATPIPPVTGAPAKFARSRQMIDCLRADFLYTEKRARDILFREIEAVLRASVKPVPVSRLIRTAAGRAGRRAARMGVPFPNWNIASRATVHAMLAAGVLLGPDGVPIARNSSGTAEAVSVRRGFQDATEACLLEFLIRRLGDVGPRDHTALAHVLFRQFDTGVPREELEGRVTALLSYMSHRVILTAAGTYYALRAM